MRNWEGARAFLEVVRSGSFRSASQVLHLSVNTLRRHVEEFEREVGLPLFTRHVDGVRITAEGELLVDAVKRMEAASFDIVRAKNIGAFIQGKVRLSVPDALGIFWLAPRLVDFQRAHTGLLIDMHCAMEPMDVLRLESDIAIHVTRPTAKDLHTVKLGSVHLMPYASQDYLDAYGTPKTITELLKHRIVLYAIEKFTPANEFAQLFLNPSPEDVVSFTSNMGISNFGFIAYGGGIGLLPTYVHGFDGMVVPVDVENIRFVRDIWLAYHPDVAKIARVRILIDWLKEIFSPKKYPWFADEFIHPRDLPAAACELSFPVLLQAFQAAKKRSSDGLKRLRSSAAADFTAIPEP